MSESPSKANEVVRCPAFTIREIVERSGGIVPPELYDQPFRDMGDEHIPFYRYTSDAYFQTEMTEMWPRVWQWACREEHIPYPGDYYVYEVGTISLIIVRLSDHKIKAYINSCLHRGTKLKASGSEGSCAEIECPYHGWSWSLDGQLQRVPCEWDFPHIDRSDLQLDEAQVGLWGGFVFVNVDGKAGPLEEYLEVLPEHFRRWDLSKRYVHLHIEKELPCNWKAAHEAFMESYHTRLTHPQLLFALADTNTQYDVFGDNVSRYYSASGVASPNLTQPLTEAELLKAMFVGDRSIAGEFDEIGEGETARSVMARRLRESLQDAYGADLSGYLDTEIIDTIGYGLFPNTVFFAGLSIPMVYRFRPMPEDPRRSVFDLIFLRPVPESGERPEPAVRIQLREEDSFASAPGMDAGLGFVFDQDLNNMRLQQEGFTVARRKGAILSRYQESRIRHFHATLEKYCGS